VIDNIIDYEVLKPLYLLSSSLFLSVLMLQVQKFTAPNYLSVYLKDCLITFPQCV